MGAKRKLVAGIGWGGLSMAVVAGSQFAFLAVLARLLTPADFGLVAVAHICLRFLSYFAQAGVVPALVQKTALEPADVPAAMAVSLALSTLCAVLAAAAAPVASWLFNMPTLAAIVAALALSFPVQGFAAVSTGLLNREMRFRALGIIDALAYVLGYGVVGTALAWTGWGAWALVGASLGQVVVQALLAYAATRHPIRLRHDPKARRHFLAYGGRHSTIGFIEFLSNCIDTIAVGKVLGDNAVGLYNRTATLANLPVYQPTRVIMRALFPVLSAAGADLRRQAIGLQLSLLAVGVYAFSVASALSVAAEPIVLILLGVGWLDVVPVLQVFALSVGPRYVTEALGTSLDAMGALQPKLWAQSFCLVLMVCAVGIALPYGLVAIASAVLVVEIVRAGLLLAAAARLLQGTPRQWSLTLAPLALVGFSSAGAAYLALQWLRGAPNWLALVAAVCAAGGATVLVTLIYRPWLIQISGIAWAVGREPRLAEIFRIADRP